MRRKIHIITRNNVAGAFVYLWVLEVICHSNNIYQKILYIILYKHFYSKVTFQAVTELNIKADTCHEPVLQFN